jgi:hypothetical protein
VLPTPPPSPHPASPLTHTYLYVSVAIGLAQVADCLIHAARQGKPGITGVVFSLVEWIWGVYSAIVIFRSNDRSEICLATIYVAYLAAWTIYLVRQVSRGRDASTYALSPREAMVGGGFGLLFALTALWLVLAAGAQ